MDRGLTMEDMRKMQLGQIVDFCIEYNNRQRARQKEEERIAKRGNRRKATQADIKSFFG